MSQTINYYNQRAEEYYQATVNVDMKELYREFLPYLETEDHILDVGCGSGRDSLYFLNHGYQVTALDGSEELVRLSSQLLKQEVLHLKFNEIDFTAQFDGIWACASLLHVRKANIESILEKLTAALVSEGVMYISFKYGNCEVRQGDRLFNYYTEPAFRKVINKISQLEIIKMWQTADKKEAREEVAWLNVLVKKQKLSN